MLVKDNLRIKPLDAIGAEELLDKEFETRPMLIDGILPQGGVVIMAGSPKIGKSWLVLNIAHIVSMGLDLWSYRTEQCGVLYISLEDTFSRIQARLAKVTNGETGPIWFSTSAELIGNGFEEQLGNFLMNHPDIKLVIVDTLQKIRQADSSNYNYSSDYLTLGSLKSLADSLGVSIVLVHHTRKAAADDPFSMISGTTGISGAVDTSLVLVKDERGSNYATLYVTGRDVLDAELKLMFNPRTCLWEFIENKGNKPKRDCLLTAISEFISENGQFHGTATTLIEYLDTKLERKINPNVLTRLLNPLKTMLLYEHGIIYDCERTANARILHLTFSPKDDDTTNSVEA